MADQDDDRRPGAAAPPRRRGLLGALAGGAVAAPSVARAVSQTEPHRADQLPPGMRPRKESEAEKRAARYRETDHVKAFYRTNRY
jgi:hypothetical protein